jgi:RNA polymerase sigma-70 factor (ECF subfamily)
MESGELNSSELLRRWKEGEAGAIDALLDSHLPWVQRLVRKRLGSALRSKAETNDFVQDAMLQFLRYGPRVMLSDSSHFRGMMARIVENTIRDRNDWFKARRRTISRERPLPSDTVLSLDPPRDEGAASPSRAAQANEDEAWIRLGIEFLDPPDRQLVVLRQWDSSTFEQIGSELGITSNAAEKRYRRAVNRLGDLIGVLRRKGVHEFLDNYSA